MFVELPADDDARRVAVRRWLEAHPDPSGKDLAEAGYIVPHWPRPWGLDADPMLQLVIEDELRRAKVQRPINPIGTGHCGPILLGSGSDEQRQRYLPPMLAGEEIWCQLFSEPEAGSDLAAVATRAERDGDVYVVNGQKTWTSLGHLAAFGIMLARTDTSAAKHDGLSYFIVPMNLPGIEVRPIIDMTGWHSFNDVFFTDVRLPADNLIGPENGGWRLAKETLVNERVTLSREGAQWGWGPTARDLVDLVRERGGAPNPAMRQRVAQLYIEGEICRVFGLLNVARKIRGEAGESSAAILKALNDPHGQHVFRLARDLTGAAGMLEETGPMGAPAGWWPHGFLFSPALTVGGGTSEVLRNIIGERTLGLPREPDVEAAVPGGTP